MSNCNVLRTLQLELQVARHDSVLGSHTAHIAHEVRIRSWGLIRLVNVECCCWCIQVLSAVIVHLNN